MTYFQMSKKIMTLYNLFKKILKKIIKITKVMRMIKSLIPE